MNSTLVDDYLVGVPWRAGIFDCGLYLVNASHETYKKLYNIMEAAAIIGLTGGFPEELLD